MAASSFCQIFNCDWRVSLLFFLCHTVAIWYWLHGTGCMVLAAWYWLHGTGCMVLALPRKGGDLYSTKWMILATEDQVNHLYDECISTWFFTSSITSQVSDVINTAAIRHDAAAPQPPHMPQRLAALVALGMSLAQGLRRVQGDEGRRQGML
jgi:hypothetical protein